MENARHRSERSKKAKQIFSPSNPLQPYYYLVTYDYPEKYRIVGRTSIQQLSNDKAVLNNVDGEVQIITSGTLDYCRRELKLKMQEVQPEDEDLQIDDGDENDDENGDDGNLSYSNQVSTSVLKRPGDGFSTPALKRSKKINNHQNRTLNRSLERNERVQSTIRVSHDHYDKTNMHRSRQANVEDGDTRSSRVLQRIDDYSNINTDNAEPSPDSNFKHQMVSHMRSLQQQMSKLTKSVGSLTLPPSTSSKHESLAAYRNENETENFPPEVMWETTNLLSFVGRDPGDYGRKLLRFLYTESELRSSLLPSQSSHLYQKDVLDGERFEKLNEAIRVKYRLSHDGYRRYYTSTLRIKLSRFLYDEGTRKTKKDATSKQIPHHQQNTKQQAATTIDLCEASDYPMSNNRDHHFNFDDE